MFKTTNGGNWSQVGPSIGNTVNFLQVAPSNSLVLYAATEGSGVYRSGDGGSSYTAVTSGLPNFTVRMLAIHPTDPNTVIAATTTGIYSTTNAGSSWTTSTPVSANFTTVVYNHANPLIVYAGATNSVGLYKSTDGGVTFTASGIGLPGNVSALVIAHSNPAVLYAVANGDVYRSSDSGLTWILASGGLLSNARQLRYGLAVHPTNAATVYVATVRSGVYRTTDSGANWTPVNAGMKDADVYAVVVDSTGTIYAGSDLERDAFVTQTQYRRHRICLLDVLWRRRL